MNKDTNRGRKFHGRDHGTRDHGSYDHFRRCCRKMDKANGVKRRGRPDSFGKIGRDELVEMIGELLDRIFWDDDLEAELADADSGSRAET